jgi:hypothetical protein
MDYYDDDEPVDPSAGKLFNGTTVEEAKAWVQLNMRYGVTCPCCGQLAKVYRRSLHSTMALALIMLYHHFKQHPRDRWVHVNAFLVKVRRHSSIAGGDAVKLRFWELLEREKSERDDGSDRVGRYRITDLGEKFVEGGVAVPKYAYTYNQLLLRMSEQTITIQQALGKKFNYSELMRG